MRRALRSAAAPPHEQTRAGITNIVRTISDDPRLGRLLLSADLANAVLVRKRIDSEALFAMLSGQYVDREAHDSQRPADQDNRQRQLAQRGDRSRQPHIIG